MPSVEGFYEINIASLPPFLATLESASVQCNTIDYRFKREDGSPVKIFSYGPTSYAIFGTAAFPVTFRKVPQGELQ